MSDLSSFEGLPVRQVGIEIPGAAGGLREAMKIDPAEFHHGDRVYVVLACDVQKVRFDPIDRAEPDGDQRRVHVFGVDTATIVEEELVRAHLDAQRERIDKANAQARMVDTSGEVDPDAVVNGDPDEDDEAAVLGIHHAQGLHSDLVAGCPDCDAEVDAEAAEAPSDGVASLDKARAKKAR